MMSAHTMLRTLHFIGVILWMGGIIASAMAAYYGASKATSAAARAINLRIATPGMLLTFAGGLGILWPTFATYYAHQPWMHVKLTLVLIAAAISGVISGTLRRASTTDEQPTGKLKTLAIVMLVILVTVVFLAVFQPGRRA
jgi:protoporphyrinogen IX oxidase